MTDFIINRSGPLSIDRFKAWHIKRKLDLNLLKKGAKILEGKHDFSAFRSSSCQATSAIKTLDYINILSVNKQSANLTLILCFVNI